jgi:PAS domain S-box-containing protein
MNKPLSDSSSEPEGEPASSGGLLGAVLNDPKLREQFQSRSADEKTIELSVSDLPDNPLPEEAFQNGTLQDEGHITFSLPEPPVSEAGSSFDTFELPSQDTSPSEQTDDLGFVPKRTVELLSGEEKGDLGEYRIVGRLGSGGTGVVYQAHQRAIEREVAIKVLRQELSYNALSRQRFITEARVIGGLDHPNVIAIHEVCKDENGTLFYSMKRIDGTSWDQRINQMSKNENLETLLGVANGIRYAHSRGLIHRDIKPENVMLGKFGEVLLADWGLAISHNSKESSTGISSSIGGTPAYMAPELAYGDNDSISFQTDIYLLGATLFHILTGFPPHRGENLLECVRSAAHNEIQPTDVQGELMDIAMRAMQSDPADRYQTVEEMIDAIDHEQQHTESARLVRRARERLSAATHEKQYEDYRIADAILNEALTIWAENPSALESRRELQLRFAELATEQGDLDLAWSIYEAAGEAESDAAMLVRRAIQERETTEVRSSRYSTLFTHSPDAGLLIRMSTAEVVEANQMFGCMFGYKQDEVVGRSIRDLNLWACPERRNELVEHLNQRGAIDDFEATFLHTDGHPIEILLAARIVEVQGETMVVSTIRDITIRKQAERELKRSRQRMHDLQGLAGIGTWSYSVVEDQVTWSSEAFALLGRSEKEGAPQKDEFHNLMHPDDRAESNKAVGNALKTGTSYEITVRFRVADNTYRALLVRGQPIVDDAGSVVEIYGVLIPQP